MTRTSHPATIGRPVNEEARAQRREQILAGARTCFLQKGFHAASTAEISAAAKVSVANLYQYFPTKDDLVRALIEQDLSSDLELIQVFDHAPSFQAGLEMITRAISKSPEIARDSQLRIEILAEASRNPAVAAVVRATDEQLVQAVAVFLSRYQNRGELSADLDPAMAARLVISLCDGLLARLAFGDEDIDHLIAATDALIMRALSPGRPADQARA